MQPKRLSGPGAGIKDGRIQRKALADSGFKSGCAREDDNDNDDFSRDLQNNISLNGDFHHGGSPSPLRGGDGANSSNVRVNEEEAKRREYARDEWASHNSGNDLSLMNKSATIVKIGSKNEVQQ